MLKFITAIVHMLLKTDNPTASLQGREQPACCSWYCITYTSQDFHRIFKQKLQTVKKFYTLLQIQFTVTLTMLYVIQKITFQFRVKYESRTDLSHIRTVSE